MAKLAAASSETEQCEIRATLLSDSFGSDAFSTSSSSSQLVLHCPACDAETFLGDQFCQECGNIQPAFESKPSFSPESVNRLVACNQLAFNRKHLVALSAFALGLIVLYFVLSVLRLPDELDKTISLNRLNDAADLAERLFVSRFGSLSGRDAESYSEAFYKRAQVFAKNRNFKSALVDLSKVLPGFSRSAEVAHLKAVCQLSLIQEIPLAKTNSAATIETRSVARQIKFKDASVQNISRTSVNNKTQVVGSNSQKIDSVIDATAVEAQSVDSANIDKDIVNSEEADMAAYNRHLAEYFSHREANIKNPKNSKVSTAKDPPSFSEWVQTGKADF